MKREELYKKVKYIVELHTDKEFRDIIVRSEGSLINAIVGLVGAEISAASIAPITMTLITDKDAKLLEKARQIIAKMDQTDERNIDYENDDIQVALGHALHNLQYGPNYFRKLPESEMKWYDAECKSCGWFGSSQWCLGGHPIGDSGDYSDPACPICRSENIE